jgi:hypothetical protein
VLEKTKIPQIVLRITFKACDVARAHWSKPEASGEGLRGERNVGGARAAARGAPSPTKQSSKKDSSNQALKGAVRAVG